MSRNAEQPRNRPFARRGTLPMRDIKSDWRRWSPTERLGAVAIGVVWLGSLSSLLVINAG